MPRTDDSAAYAANWRTLLIVDAGLGVVVLVAGVALAVAVERPGVDLDATVVLEHLLEGRQVRDSAAWLRSPLDRSAGTCTRKHFPSSASRTGTPHRPWLMNRSGYPYRRR